jgi:PTH1 family peptidyl-tRNA hydrolase
MYLVAGLGNPGREYNHTRHNLGFRVIDHLAGELGAKADRPMLRAHIAKVSMNGAEMVLAKPQSYMNRSGEPVAALLNWYKIPSSRLIVVYDDLDLPPGKLRIRQSGGAGGHKGVLSVMDKLGISGFYRIRLGIGRPPVPGPDAADWVLGRFGPEEQELVDQTVVRASQAIRELILYGTDVVMNKFNSPAGKSPF